MFDILDLRKLFSICLIKHLPSSSVHSRSHHCLGGSPEVKIKNSTPINSHLTKSKPIGIRSQIYLLGHLSSLTYWSSPCFSFWRKIRKDTLKQGVLLRKSCSIGIVFFSYPWVPHFFPHLSSLMSITCKYVQERASYHGNELPDFFSYLRFPGMGVRRWGESNCFERWCWLICSWKDSKVFSKVFPWVESGPFKTVLSTWFMSSSQLGARPMSSYRWFRQLKSRDSEAFRQQ